MSQGPNHLADLLNQPELQAEADKISLRLAHLLAQLCSIFSSAGDEWLPHQEEQLHLAFKTITYTREQNSGPICRTCDEKLKYYRCFDCEISNSCFCEKCFNDPQHAGHQFKIVPSNANNYCDCGNEEFVRKEHFCKEHRDREHENECEERGTVKGSKESNIKSKEKELFGREMEFLLFVGLQAKRKSMKDHPQRALLIALKTLQILAFHGNNSYTYQQLTAQLLLQPFRFNKAQKETILHQYMWQEWDFDPLNTVLAKVLCQLYTCKKARKSILIEYFHLHASEEHIVSWVNPLTQIDNQYLLQGNLILRLLKGKLISPLTSSYNFAKGDVAAACFIQIYRAYRIMHESASFREILEESLAILNFSKFFSFAIIDRENRSLLNQVTNYYLVFLKIIVQRLQEFKGKPAAEKKIIRQCYQYIKNKEELYSFAPERTIGWIIFSHCDCDLDNLANCSVEWMMDLLGEDSVEELKATIEKMFEGFCNIFRIQNYNDYRELTSEKSELNTNNKLIISMDYTTVHIIVTFLEVLSREKEGETVPLRNVQVGKHSILEKWTYLYRAEKMKKDAVSDPEAKAQIITLMETGLFVKLDDQIAGVTIQLIGIINNLLFACESDICETVLANSMNKAQASKIMKILKEFAWMHPNKTKLEFKSQVESVIFNQKMIKEFIVGKDDIMRNTKIELYQSNLTYCSRYFTDDITDDTSQRFLKKLESCRKGTVLTRFLFSDAMITQLIKFTQLFIRFITASVDLKEAATINVTFNLLLESLIIVFTETRNERLKRILFKINETPLLRDNYTDYTVIIIRILMNYFNQKEQADDQGKRKETAKMKRELKMRQIKEKQSKFLEQHCSSSKIQENVQQNIDLCIICKTPSVQEQQLSYLCKIRFSNTLTRSILASDNVMMVITTCGHKIHESCLASNIDARDKYGTKYHCFLCKHISNIRIPINLPPSNIETFLQYFLTIISLQISSNASFKQRTEEYSSISNLSKMLYDNIVLSIFLYFYSFSKFYNAYILPIVGAEISVLKWLKQSFAVPKRVDFSGKDQRIRLVQNKLNTILDAKTMIDDIGQKEEKQQVDQLFLKIKNPTQIITQQVKKIDRFNFLKLPQDLSSLTKWIGKCKYCSKLNNKTVVCFLCNFKCCSDCNAEINKHIDIHLGTCVLIDVENGHLCYRFRNIQVQSNSLYTNYAGQEFSDQAELPPKGEFQLSQERLEKLIDEVLKDQIQSIVQDYVWQAEMPPGCNIQ